MKLHPRLIARAACMVAALGCAGPVSAADTPRDYAMPYTINTANGLNSKGIVLVNSANFGQSKVLVGKANAVGQPGTVVSGDVDDTGLHNLRPHSLLWAQDGHFMRVPLRTGLEPTPEQVSSESSANKACDYELIYRDFTVAADTTVFYQLPGDNNTCNDNDDKFRWINVSDGAGADPSNLAGFDQLELSPIYKPDGKLHAIYTLQGGAILRIASDLANITTVKSGVNRFEVVGWLPDATVVALIDGNLERIRPNGALGANPLHRPKTGYRIAQAWLNQGIVYFAERAKEDGTAIQTRIARVGADGAGDALMVTARLPAAIQGFTANRLLYTLDDDEADTVTLFSFAKDGVKGDASQKIYRASALDITVFTTQGDNVFFNVAGVVLFPELVFNSAAYVYTDGGDQVKFYGAGSAFLGGQITDSGAGAFEQQETFDRVMLGTKGRVDTPNIASAKLFSLDPATLQASLLVDLQNRMQPLFSFGFGPGSIGGLLNLDNSETDVYAFDLVNVRFRLLTDGTATSELPTF